mmetsp:Transcript_362/g.37  ORF Transcript_362/g.37 Transcript_362/m.37 type:complete len:108 (-) Transcript_362:633-956(-)
MVLHMVGFLFLILSFPTPGCLGKGILNSSFSGFYYFFSFKIASSSSFSFYSYSNSYFFHSGTLYTTSAPLSLILSICSTFLDDGIGSLNLKGNFSGCTASLINNLVL